MTRGATNTAVQGIGRHDRARTQQAGLNDTTLTKTPVQAPIQHRISERYMPLNHARPGQQLGIRPSSMAKDTRMSCLNVGGTRLIEVGPVHLHVSPNLVWTRRPSPPRMVVVSLRFGTGCGCTSRRLWEVGCSSLNDLWHDRAW
jgi:hypothetical protein